MDYSALTIQKKQNIFEIVNSTHLHLKGDPKKILKRSFVHDWKINKGIGLFELMIKLYESEDVYDKMLESFKEYLNNDTNYQAEDVKKKEHISYVKHVRRVAMMQKDIDDLYSQLEDVKEGKGYISQEDHEEILKEQLEEQKQIIREKSDTIGKLRNTEDALREKLLSQQKHFEEKIENYEKTIHLISKNN